MTNRFNLNLYSEKVGFQISIKMNVSFDLGKVGKCSIFNLYIMLVKKYVCSFLLNKKASIDFYKDYAICAEK